MTISRRSFMGALSALAGATILGGPSAEAETDADMPLFIFGYFQGAWDTLLSLDPRDNTTFPTIGSDIDPAMALAAAGDTELAAELSQNPTGLVQPNGSNIVFGSSVGRLANLYEELAVVRGVDMGTLTHEVGRRYFLTGKFPRGLQAVGSALPTWIVSPYVDQRDIPNLSVGVESYNEGLSPSASAMRINSAADLGLVMLPIQPELAPGPASRAAIDEYLAVQRCHDQQLDGSGRVSDFMAARPNAARLSSGELFEHFNFVSNPEPSSELAELYEAFNVSQGNFAAQLAGPAGQAMIAAQALRWGISQAVSIVLASGIDHHDNDWQTDHSVALRNGFNAAADLITFLKNTQDGEKSSSLWDRTTLVLFSEFARTPGVNARGGRDHHLANSCVIAGQGIRGNQVIGATNDNNYGVMPVNFASGAPSESGEVIRPTDLHATVLEAMGMSHEPLANQEPRIIEALLA
ncbi:MAG TPA: DUF1501 domain-containing protein [Polyangiaceae bacterium]|nr:DUF1501 domain-containing protein [Polyangiaceae bacterium]